MRYRLRTLLILVTIVAAFFGGRASLAPRIRQGEDKAAELQLKMESIQQHLVTQQQDRKRYREMMKRMEEADLERRKIEGRRQQRQFSDIEQNRIIGIQAGR